MTNQSRGTQHFSSKFRKAYLVEIGIRHGNKAELRFAYDTAHRIREFEIGLYWKRTAYVWAMQAALIGIAALLLTQGDTTYSLDATPGWRSATITSSTALSASVSFALTLLSALALTIACLWAALIQGAKYWQNNWEQHVDILGHELGQNLYQVYPIKGKQTLPPFSVTKLNRYVVYAFIFFWLHVFCISLWSLSSIHEPSSVGKLALCFLGFVFLIALAFFFCLVQFRNSTAYQGMRMSAKMHEVTVLEDDARDTELKQRHTPL